MKRDTLCFQLLVVWLVILASGLAFVAQVKALSDRWRDLAKKQIP